MALTTIETGIPLVTEDTITVADDYVLFLDGSATGNANKEQFSDVMTLIAGTGLSASSGVLNVDAAQTGITSLGTQVADVKVGNGYGLIVGHTAQITTGGQIPELQVLGNDTLGHDSRIALGRFTADGDTGVLMFMKSRDPAIADGTFAIVQDNDRVVEIRAMVDDGVDYATSAGKYIMEVDDASPAENDVGIAHVWQSLPGGGDTSINEVMRISAAGNLELPLGAKLGFDTGAGDTYIYQESADDLHIVVGGGTYMQIDQDKNSMSTGLNQGPNGFARATHGGAFTSDGTSTIGVGSYNVGTLAGAAGDTDYLVGHFFGTTIATQTATESIGLVTQLRISEPTITDNLTGDITIASTVYITGAPTEGETNAAIYVASGDVTLGNDSNINLSEAGKIDFGDEAPLDNAATGIVFSFIAGETLVIGETVYIHTDGEVYESDANNVAKMPAVGICVGAGSNGSAVDVLVQGIMHDTSAFPTFSTVGQDVFVSGTLGEITATAPSGSGDTVQKIGVALHADMVYFNFNTTEILLA